MPCSITSATPSIPNARSSTATSRASSPTFRFSCCFSSSSSTASTMRSMERALAAPKLAHYRPWIADLRKERPHQLDDRIEELFHEKSLTGWSAWNRLFDETMAALALHRGGRRAVARADAEASARPRRGQAPGGRRGACANARRQSQAVHADHQHPRQGQGDQRSLAPFRGRDRFAPSRQPGGAAGGRGAGRGGAKRLSAPVAPLLRAQGPLARQGRLAHWDRNAPAARGGHPRSAVGRGQAPGARRLWRVCP
jgi:hypothetical protein